MLEFRRIGGPAEPTRIEREEVRSKTASSAPQTSAQDQVRISPEGQIASNILKFSEAVKNLPDVRQERVDAARGNLEQGNYRRPEVVQEVAARVARYVINE